MDPMSVLATLAIRIRCFPGLTYYICQCPSWISGSSLPFALNPVLYRTAELGPRLTTAKCRACGVRGSVVGKPCRWLPCLWKQRWRHVAMNLNRSWVPSGNQRWSCLMVFPLKFADGFPIQTCQPCLIEGKCCAMAIFWACAGNIPSLLGHRFYQSSNWLQTMRV